jgi:hypothetical protein
MSGMHLQSIAGICPRVRRLLCAALAAVAVCSMGTEARAQLVTGWGLDTGLANATLTEGVPGSFSVTAPPAGQNAGPRALLASPISFANVGDAIKLSGMATMTNGLGNQQFRFGLYNPNGHATGTLSGGLWTGADVTGWLGYMFQLGGSTGSDAVRGRDGTGAAAWLANANSQIIGSTATTVSAPANIPYTFSLTLTRTGVASVRADYTFVGGSINRSGTFNDTIPTPSASMTSFTAVGFLLNGNTGGAQMSNVIVEAPPALRLRVNATTGLVSIANKTSSTTFTTNYYEITSATGSLAPASWLSLDGNLPASNTTWEKAGGSTANIVSETNLQSSLTISPQSAYQALGKAFVPGGTQDLAFRYALPDGTLQSGFVEYVTGLPAGDFDVDGDVDGRDFLVWQRGVGSAFTSADLTNWRNTFGQTTPAIGAGQSAPEPASMALVALSAVAVVGCTRRRPHG